MCIDGFYPYYCVLYRHNGMTHLKIMLEVYFLACQ
jgi:hypothetical protein